MSCKLHCLTLRIVVADFVTTFLRQLKGSHPPLVFLPSFQHNVEMTERNNEQGAMGLDGKETMDIDGCPNFDDSELGQAPTQRSVCKTHRKRLNVTELGTEGFNAEIAAQ